MLMKLSHASLKFMAQAALRQIDNGPTDEAAPGAAALAQLLAGTAADTAAHQLLFHLASAARAAEAVTTALDADPTVFP